MRGIALKNLITGETLVDSLHLKQRPKVSSENDALKTASWKNNHRFKFDDKDRATMNDG